MKEIILSAPGKNAVSSELLRKLADDLRSAAGEPVLLTGAGDAFSAGLNLKELLTLDSDRMREFLGLFEDVVQALFEYPGPTVALVNGHAIAGGCILVLGCDLRIMQSDTGGRIGLNEVAIGLRFPPRALALVKARLGRSEWERVVLGAGLHDAAGALELGLVDEINENASRVAGERLAALASHPADAYARAKRALREGLLEVTSEQVARFEHEDLPVWTGEPFRARIRQILGR